MATFHQVNAQNLECPVCLSTFKQPKSLACSHTFCKGCLQEILETRPDGKTLPCPVCRQQTPLPSGDVSGLQTNIPLQSLVDDVTIQNPVCTNCKSDENPLAVSYCQECHKNMCVSCEKTHAEWSAFSEHQVVPTSDILSGKVSIKRRQKCKNHPNEVDEFFCSECRKYICFRCGMLEHQHNGQRIIAALVHEEKVMANIRDLTEQADTKEATLREHSALIDAQLAEITDIIEQVDRNIDQAFEDYTQQLEERKATLKEELKQISERLKCRLVTMVDENEEEVKHVQVMKELVGNGAKVPLEKDALSAHDTLCEDLKGMLGREDPSNEQPEAVLQQAKRVSFHRNRGMNELGLGVIRNHEWSGKADVGLPAKDSMECIVATPDGRMAVGCSSKRGIHLYSSDGKLQKTVLKDVYHINRGIGFLSDGLCVVIEGSNNIRLYTPRWESKLGVMFESLGYDEGGFSDIAVDNDDLIYVSYMKPQEIHVFTPDGGKPIRKIPCGGDKPIQICSFQAKRNLVVKHGRKFVCLDSKQGDTINSVSQPGKYPYPAVCRDDSVILAWVHQDEGIVSIDRYTSELEHVESLITDHKIEKSSRGDWYYLQEFFSGDIAFCTTDRLYIFKKSYI